MSLVRVLSVLCVQEHVEADGKGRVLTSGHGKPWAELARVGRGSVGTGSSATPCHGGFGRRTRFLTVEDP